MYENDYKKYLCYKGESKEPKLLVFRETIPLQRKESRFNYANRMIVLGWFHKLIAVGAEDHMRLVSHPPLPHPYTQHDVSHKA